MKTTIWKYSVRLGTTDKLEMPSGAKILSVQLQRPDPMTVTAQMWCLIPDRNAPMVQRSFVWYGTGETIFNNPGEYVATVQFDNGRSVFHLFEVTL